MEISDTSQGKNQTDNTTTKIFYSFFVQAIIYIVISGILYLVHVRLAALNADILILYPRTFGAILLLFVISAGLFILALVLYSVPFIIVTVNRLVRHKSLPKKSDLQLIAEMQVPPTSKSSKIRRILLWVCCSGSTITILANIICQIVIFSINYL